MKINKNVTLSATFMTERQEPVINFNAYISKDNPNEASYSSSVINADLYRTNEEQINAARKEFETEFYKEKDSMKEE